MISKRSFALQNKLSEVLLNSLCKIGIIQFIKKGKRILIEENNILKLSKGDDYVECPHCLKKFSCVTSKHFKKCGNMGHQNNLYSKKYIKNHEKTEDQKRHQSTVLKERFKTPKGGVTKKIIGDASKKFNADPEFKKKKIMKSIEVNNRPEIKINQSLKSLKRWADPMFKEKMKTYVKENIEALKKSAKNARSYLKKQSNLHIGYKETMLKNNLKGFISEYPYGPYSIDEADPLAKIAIEVDGCYWHGCVTCDFTGDTRIQKTDLKKTAYLKNRGWIIFRIKEHEIKRDPLVAIEMIRNIQEKRKQANILSIRESFFKGKLFVKSMVGKEENPQWKPMSDFLRHNTAHKKMVKITTPAGSVKVTEDHSLFLWGTKEPIEAINIKAGDLIVGAPWENFEPLKVSIVELCDSEEHSFDVSVPETENALLDSGILVHNSYSISGVSLDIEKSSKYQSMKDEYISEYDKQVEAAKRSIKILKGLRQSKYGIGLNAALGPLSRPGVQSRANFVSSGGPSWS